VAQLIAFGTSLYLLAVLAEPIRVATGWGLPMITGGLSIGVLAGAIISPLVGRRIGGFASSVFWLLSGVLVASVGWRATCLIYAGMHLLVALPIYRCSFQRSSSDIVKPAIDVAKVGEPRRDIVWLTGGIFMVAPDKSFAGAGP